MAWKFLSINFLLGLTGIIQQGLFIQRLESIAKSNNRLPCCNKQCLSFPLPSLALIVYSPSFSVLSNVVVWRSIKEQMFPSTITTKLRIIQLCHYCIGDFVSWVTHTVIHIYYQYQPDTINALCIISLFQSANIF